MTSIAGLLDSFFEKESTMDAEFSYTFLRMYQFYLNWNVYDSDKIGLGTTHKLSSLFCSLHGKIAVSSEKKSGLMSWSGDPLGFFRYRMDSSNNWLEISYLNKFKGYIVEGGYWSNGLVYRVRENDVVLQMKLFVDDFTVSGYYYPETEKVSQMPMPL
jgi:hypothetical protein